MDQLNNPFFSGIKKWIVAFFVLLFIAAISLLPQGISYGVKNWLIAHGGEQVKIGDVDFNLLSATFALHDLEIRQQSDLVLKIPEFQLRLTWTPFLSKQLFINRVMIKGVQIEVDRSNPERLLVGGIALPDASTVENAAQNASLPWGIGIEKLEILDSEIQYRDEKLDMRFNIEALTLTELASYLPEQAVKLKLKGAINDAPILLDGQVVVFSDAPSFKSQIALQAFNLDLLNELVEADISHIGGQLTLESRFSANYQSDDAWVITQKGEISLKQIDVKRGNDYLETESLQWEGGVQLQISSQGKPQAVIVDGAIQIAALNSASGSPSLAVVLKDARWQGHINHQAAEEEKTDIEGEFNLNDLLVNTSEPQGEFKQRELSWRGKMHLEKQPIKEAQQISVQGEVASIGLDLQMPKHAIELSYGNMAWRGDVFFSQGDEAGKIELAGTIDIDRLQALDTNEHYLLLGFDQLKIEEIAAELHDGEIKSEQIIVKQLALGRPMGSEEPGLLQIENLKIKEIYHSAQNGIQIDSIEQQNLTHLTRRDREGRWNEQALLDILHRVIALEDGEDASQPEAMQEGSAEKPLPVRINSIQVRGDSRLTFQDDLPDPPYRAELDIHHFSLDGLNSAEPTGLSPIAFDATLNQRSTLKFEGGLAPFAPQLTMALKGQIERLALPPLTSYTGKLLGYSLDSGELNVDVVFDAKAGEIQGDNKLKLHQLDVSPLSEEKMKGLNAQLDIPLETALGMLRDSNNTIALDLPLSGSINDLKVDPSDAINQAIGKALKKGATTYLTAALFPFGTMLAVARIAGEEAAKIRLDPILFSPGLDRLSSTNDEYLGKIAAILKERPEMHIKVCGRAVESDQAALLQFAQQKLDKEFAVKKVIKGEKSKPQTPIKPKPITEQQLKLLADNRAAAIESYLAEKEGVKPNRLISCQPIAELDEKAAEPRVELLL